ncbi:hypothetical protein Nmel_013034 [Mimus melanotis]
MTFLKYLALFVVGGMRLVCTLVSALCCKGGYSGTLIVLEEEDNGMETKDPWKPFMVSAQGFLAPSR